MAAATATSSSSSSSSFSSSFSSSYYYNYLFFVILPLIIIVIILLLLIIVIILIIKISLSLYSGLVPIQDKFILSCVNVWTLTTFVCFAKHTLRIGRVSKVHVCYSTTVSVGT